MKKIQPTKNTVTDKITKAPKAPVGKSKAGAKKSSKKFNAGAFAAAKKKHFGMM